MPNEHGFRNLNIQGEQIGQEGLPLPIVRVFNENYVKTSVLSRLGNLEHIVFFGEKTVEHEQQRQAAIDELSKHRDAWKELSPKKSEAARKLDG